MLAFAKRNVWKTMAFMAGALLSAFPNGAGAEPSAPTRVALMDFSTDENSYRSIQAAADFTSLVQIELAGEAGIEWVERAQISLAKQEFGLAGLKAAGGSAPLRQGRMLGADWLVTGHFSSDDKSRATLAIQVIELKHADVIAEETVTLPDQGKGWAQLESGQVTFAVGALRKLFTKAQVSQQQMANQARIAFLFLADTSSWPGFRKGTEVLSRELSDELERAVAANGKIRLIRFPKAYQSTGESELVVDGIIEAGQDSWSRTADLYVWGTYSVTNTRTPGRMESRLDLGLNLWDGADPPVTLKESLTLAPRESLPPAQTSELIRRLIPQVISRARPQRSEHDSTAVRQQIADSIVKAYVAMTGRGRSELGLHDREKFVQVVHMLETACYFDPDNADARVLWVTSRYGWWVDFGFNVKNQFWTKYRRSQAWGKYVDRFGLKPGSVELPFPFQARGGIPEAAVRSLDDVVELFPQWDSVAEALEDAAKEDQSRRQGVHTVLMEAEYHGFPKQMPPELTMKWKTELTNELVQRKKRAAEYAQAQASNTNALPAKTLVRSAGAISNQASLATAKPLRPTSVPQSAPRVSPMVPAPAWLKQYMSFFGMFRLSPPNLRPNEITPEVQRIQFPPSFEVRVIRQLAYHEGRLWVLAMDERSSPSSDATPDLSGETLDKRNRLWCLAADGTKPELFKADSLPTKINSFLFQDDQLWLAGESVGVLDLKHQSFRKYGLAEGLAMREIETLAFAGGRLVAAGDSFRLSSFDPAVSRWENLPLPPAGLSHGSEKLYLLTGNERWLAYGAGATLLRDFVVGSWTNLAPVHSPQSFAFDDSTCWIGSASGLHAYTPKTRTLRSWNAPVSVQSPMVGMGYGHYMGNQTIQEDQLEALAGQIRGSLGKMARERRQRRADRRNQKDAMDPLSITSRIPEAVTALANDGEFLWLGFDNKLLLLHKPSLALVASCPLGVRHSIASLAVSDTYVWAGTAYGDNSLVRFRKDAFQSVPRSRWTSLAILSPEREQLVRAMPPREQALYAFYASDDERVVQVLGGTDPVKASLEEMFLLAWSYDVAGVDDPQQSRRWFEQICLRHPGSPWADYALAAFQENDAAHASLAANALAIAKFDRNHDGKLDESEKKVMRRDPDFTKVQKSAADKQRQFDMQQIVKTYDQDGDHKLNPAELKVMRQHIASHLLIKKERPDFQARSRLLDPLVSDRVPPADKLLPKYDADKDDLLDAAELGVLAAEIWNEKE